MKNKYNLLLYKITDREGCRYINETRIQSRKGKMWKWGKIGFMGIKFYNKDGSDFHAWFDIDLKEKEVLEVIGVYSTFGWGCRYSSYGGPCNECGKEVSIVGYRHPQGITITDKDTNKILCLCQECFQIQINEFLKGEKDEFNKVG